MNFSISGKPAIVLFALAGLVVLGLVAYNVGHWLGLL